MPFNQSFGTGVVAIWWMLFSSQIAAEPFIPNDPNFIVETLPAVFSASERALRTQRSALEAEPNRLDVALEVAWGYVELNRRSGDPRYLGWAEGILAPWIMENDPPSDVLLLRATLRQNRHDFETALSDLANVLKQDPRNARAWLTQATILQVQARPAPARQSCSQLLRTADTLLATLCLARVGSISGQAQRSITILENTLAANPDAPLSLRQYAFTTLAEIAQQIGQFARAETWFRSALAAKDPEPYLLAAYSDFLLEAARPDEVRSLLGNGRLSEPLMLRRVLAGINAEDAEIVESAAREAAVLRDRYTAASARNAQLHRGEEARFALQVLEDPSLALILAQENFLAQREPRDFKILMDAALAANQVAAARPALDLMTSIGLEDHRLEVLKAKLEAQ